MDLEGSNSGERAELAPDTEKSLACFALVASDLMIVNIKAEQLFLQSSGLNLILMIKEASKRVSNDKMDCRLLIVLRDFSKRSHGEDNCR
jgi:hypothetical protein